MFFDSEEFTNRMLKKGSKRIAAKPKAPETILRPFVEFTDNELWAVPVGSRFVYDVETFENYWLCSFKSIDFKKVVCFELSPESNFNCEKLRWMMFRFCTIGFNSSVYDMPMVFAACEGYSTQFLKMISDKIIFENMRPRDISREYRINIPQETINHIDLIEVAPLEGSLKLYAGRLQAPHMQDLPFDHKKLLSKDDALKIKHYNVNDLDNTELLYLELEPEIKLREHLSKEYKQDLRSRSDAQIAESVIVNEIRRIKPIGIKRPDFPAGTFFKYQAPAFIKFELPQLQSMLKTVSNVVFETDGNGSPKLPKEIEDLELRIGSCIYQMGNGGLHSQEKTIAHVADAETFLIDRDVASFYPRIILNEKLYPSHLGETFLQVYDSIVEKRLAAKQAKDKTTADALKITINGGFGKFGNMYSMLYSPHLMIQVTVTGQLALLMLIEMIESAGIPVVSGNTDGVLIKCPARRYQDLNCVMRIWEQVTGFVTEETRYSAIYCRDVNNYFAVKDLSKETESDAKKRATATLLADRLGVKVKGVYSEIGSALNSVLSKNPQTLICSDAVLLELTKNIPVKETIDRCKDIRRFCTVKRVNGGAEKNGVYIGKVIRWYYAENQPGPIRYISNGKAVGKSEGAKPLMDLPPSFPNDLNYQWYYDEAERILLDIGRLAPKSAPLFNQFF